MAVATQGYILLERFLKLRTVLCPSFVMSRSTMRSIITVCQHPSGTRFGSRGGRFSRLSAVLNLHLAGRLCAVQRTSPFSRAGASGTTRRAGTAELNSSDADVIYYLHRIRLPFMGICKS